MKNQKGFLLLEAVILMTVISVLLIVLLPKAEDVMAAANKVARSLSVDGALTAMYTYKVNHNKYPTVRQLNNSLHNKGVAERRGIQKDGYKIDTYEDTNCTNKTDNVNSDKVRCVK